MSVTRIAVRYARPLLDLAEEKKVLEQVYQDMVNFTEICTASRDFVLMLRSPIISHLKKSSILKEIFGKKVNDITAQFFDVVVRKQRESLLPDIAKEFVTLYNIKKGLQEVTITTTFAMDASTRGTVEKLVEDITGKKPLLTEKVDPNIIGGYILKLGDRQIDESISGQLKDLRLKFQKETI